MDCSMSIEQKLWEVKIFQLQSMLNAIRHIDQRFAFKNSRISCLALIFKLKNQSTTVLFAKKSVAGGEVWQVICSFFEQFIRAYGLVVKTGCRVSGDLGSIPDECWNPLSRHGQFAWHWASQCTDPSAFYIAALSRIFFFLDIVSGYLALTEL